MNLFSNTKTNLMNLQFGNEECVKMHIGKTHNIDYSYLTIDSWKEEISENLNGRKVQTDKYDRKTVMEKVIEKYLGKKTKKYWRKNQ